jgi:hypothetical protein
MANGAYPIVAIHHFIEATRDTGYKSTGSALAELIDNAFEASATHVEVTVESGISAGAGIVVRVTDDGEGMTPDVLRIALQFGGSTRFGSRKATGRYGMGLPNGGLSQARRLQVFTWAKRQEVWMSHLDVDEIGLGTRPTVPAPRVVPARQFKPKTRSGTAVVLTKCDRLDCENVSSLVNRLSAEFGRIFRKSLYEQKKISINGRNVEPIDPLFVRPGHNMVGARLFGPPLQYAIRVPQELHWHTETSTVNVQFSELPLERWHGLSNEKKNESGIAKNAGVSILRAGREIDYGWYFMGSKRKENYDDWWRCEVAFSPELDELFGVTHSKQKINPSEIIRSILTREVERVARDLNNRVRKKYAAIRKQGSHGTLMRKFEARDHLLDPPRHSVLSSTESHSALLRKRNSGIHGLRFRVEHESCNNDDFYVPLLKGPELRLVLNECHPFYSMVYSPLAKHISTEHRESLQSLLLLLVASARAECMFGGSRERAIIKRFRKLWGDTVAAFLS